MEEEQTKINPYNFNNKLIPVEFIVKVINKYGIHKLVRENNLNCPKKSDCPKKLFFILYKVSS